MANSKFKILLRLSCNVFKKGVDVRTAPGDGRFIFATAGPPEGVPVALRLKSEASHTGVAVDLPKIEEAIGALLRAASAPSGASDSASASASNDGGDAATSAEAAGDVVAATSPVVSTPALV